MKGLSIGDIKNQGYSHYEILSSENACPICQEHDGEIVSVEDAQESINLPPFHPNCKCSIVGYLINIHDDPGITEANVWNEVLHGDLSDAQKVQRLRDLYTIGDEHADTEIMIYLSASAARSDKTLNIIEGFINRLNPNWVDTNIKQQFDNNWSGEYIDDKFLQKVTDIAILLGITPDDLMTVMAAESRLDPTSANKFAIGLIQFTNPACRQIGTTREALAEMSALEQLDWVFRYFENFIGKIHNAVDMYWAMCTNKPIGKNPDDVVFDSDNPNEAGYYNNNSGMDHDGDGKITRGDLEEHLKRQLEDYWNHWAN